MEHVDLLVVVHPWASSADGLITEGLPWDTSPCHTAYPLYINWRTLSELDGAVVVYPPDGYVVRMLSRPTVRGDVMRADVHLVSQTRDRSLKSNFFWLSMPRPAARPPAVSSRSTFKAEEHAHSTCGIVFMSLEGVDGQSVDVFKARSRRKSVPYQLGATGRAARAAAATPLESGAWACRVGMGYTSLHEGNTGAALFAPFCESPTSAVISTRKGHRLAGVDRAVGLVCEAVSALVAAELVFFGPRGAGGV